MRTDPHRQRLHDDLRGLVDGEVLCDEVSLQLYASDASVYQIRPLAVVRPRSAADISATVTYAGDHGLAIHPRGSGSGVAGESLGPGIILDMSCHLRRVTLHEDGGTVTAQSGATLASVNRLLAHSGRWYGPDPATRAITTMGGVIASNASGSHYLRSGSARDTLESVRVINASGELVEFSQHPPEEYMMSPSDVGDQPGVAYRNRVARGLREIRNQFAIPLQSHAFRSPASNGYRLDDFIDSSDVVDLAKFYAGTQGTLAVMVDATFRTELIPAHRGVVLLFFRRLDSAMRAAVTALDHGPIACDVMDRRLLQIAREGEKRFADLVPREAEAGMLVEIQGESLGDLYHRLGILRQTLATGPDAAFSSQDTVQNQLRDLFWVLFRRVIQRQYRVPGRAMPLPFVEDIYSPPETLPQMLVAVQDVLKRFQTTATVFAHAGHGQLHVRPVLDLANEEDRRRVRPLSEAIAEVVWRQGGQIGVEHAAGLSRSFLMPTQFGDLWPAMGQVKRLFDPQHRFNAGKLFGAVLQKPDENLRPLNHTIEIVEAGRSVLPLRRGEDPTVSLGTVGHAAEPVKRTSPESTSVISGDDSKTAQESERRLAESAASKLVASLLPHEPPPQLEVLQQWPGSSPITTTTRQCNGCGRCRSHSDDERQCPMFRISAMEEASPRAKANLLRGVLSGELNVNELTGERAKAVADLCFNCHSCRVECPASVDIPKVVGEIKAQYVATNGMPLSDWLVGRLDVVAAIGSRVAWLANFLLRRRSMRWLGENLFGLSAARDIPSLTNETFVRYATRRRWHKSSPHGGLKVVYFVDHYANYHDPEIGRALAEILQHNRIGFYVPVGQGLSGMGRITSGDLKGARRVARRNVRILADAVRQGYTVLASEPAAALCLKHEYPNLLDSEDAHLVARHSHEACEYLWSLHEEDRLELEFQRIDHRVIYHQPCHSRVLDRESSAARLMRLIPGLEVETIHKGCSGMAGTWGLQRKNYRNSLRIGWPMISAVRRAGDAAPATECSACKLQMEHGGNYSAVHPLKLLAHAYGRMPRPVLRGESPTN
ncbi:anaerobic glycerol-3-phosphate dehydrogenase subunit C [Aporhodopirellula aestuarii]|uniref:Anaerobic glycerol-3-phosphate dehydrogenase subunit C n=1 Tax=Aporhodopirellula aestuarii TaxID=2950107 RepID=A0ABT0UBE1_9BACT|nr:anaerobic glycerol-3-phosphate dehydrogenase subunit C [Aporhodopirellula aestuarii]MCM2374322.1 anaerobic glycerol-3-phosphate dehydrogenase subunit C [Aporhodopirellula aestuarii]